MRSLFRDDTRIISPSWGIGRIHSFAYAKILSRSCVPRFLSETPPSLTSREVLRPFENRIPQNIFTTNLFEKIMDNARRERRQTFAAEMKRMGPKVRDKLIYEHIMRVMNGAFGEIFTNDRLTAWGVIPPRWILSASANVPETSTEKKVEFISQLFGGGEYARKDLLRTGCAKCFEIASFISPLTAQDLKHTIGFYDLNVDYSESDAGEALFRYMSRNNVPPPDFVADILMDPFVRFEGHKLPDSFVTWAVDALCENVCRGSPPSNNISICEVVDFIFKCQAIKDRDLFVSWIRYSVRQGMKCGLWDNLPRTDREMFSFLAHPEKIDNVEDGEEEEVNSVYTPL